MSSIMPLERLFESPAVIEERLREQRAAVRGEGDHLGEPPTLRCRVCGLEAPEPVYCPKCLADTMEPLRGR